MLELISLAVLLILCSFHYESGTKIYTIIVFAKELKLMIVFKTENENLVIF